MRMAVTNPWDPPSSIQTSPADHQEERGSVNPDGSVNLGLRLRTQPLRAVLPDPACTNRGQNGQQPPLSSNLTAYASSLSNQATPHHNLNSLNHDNRLPPMTSYPSPTQRHPSLSPNSFLSPSRKRSFAELDNRGESGSIAEQTPSANSKRLSSIKSILNPGFSDSSVPDADSHLHPTASPSQYTPSPASSVNGAVQNESERAKLERRELLQREAERMREALKAKERELAELAENE